MHYSQPARWLPPTPTTDASSCSICLFRLNRLVTEYMSFSVEQGAQIPSIVDIEAIARTPCHSFDNRKTFVLDNGISLEFKYQSN